MSTAQPKGLREPSPKGGTGCRALADYLEAGSITTEEFARRLKVDPISVGRYLRGERRPNWAVMRRIVKETGGAVTPNDFMEVAKKKPIRPSGREVSRAA